MLRMLFEKRGDSVWISHLDLMRVFQRAFRRAGLLLKHSQGFTPRAIVSIALPLSVGAESSCELLDFELEGEYVSPAVLTQLLNEKLPAGIRVLETYEATRKIKELTHLRALVTLEYDNGIPAGAEEAIRSLFGEEQVILEKHSRKGKTETDILPLLCRMELSRLHEKALQMDVLVCAQNPSLNPQLLVTAVETYRAEFAPDHAAVMRMEIFDQSGCVFR